MARRKKKTTEPKFEGRVRFNWGYHRGVQAVREQWATPARNYGFGPGVGEIRSVADVLAKHHDAHYARGFVAGFNAATAGTALETSEPAWLDALARGDVTIDTARR